MTPKILTIGVTALLLMSFAVMAPTTSSFVGVPDDPIEDLAPTPEPTPDAKKCHPKAKYKNHGQYVSCVAKNKDLRGPGPGNSSAAKSNIGKKHK